VTEKMTRLQALRIQKGRSVHDVGFVGELDPATVSRVERLLVRPRKDTVVRMAKGLRTPPKRVWELIEADWADKILAEHDAEETVA
jgi:transcriptional regulator with XRE-family HTH domain